MIPPDGDGLRHDLVCRDGCIVSLPGITARDHALRLDDGNTMKHQSWTQWHEDNVTAPHLSAKRRDEHEVSVAYGGLHALPRAGHPKLAPRSHGVADEPRSVWRRELQ